jgi:hypothetical protein
MMQALLESTFGDCKFKHISDCNGSYENTTNTEFYIYDPPPEINQPVRIVAATDDYQLTIQNPNNFEICLVKTDRCLFPNDIAKCDCLLFNDEKFFFVEIKTSSTGGMKEKRNKAVKQLGATISILKNNEILLTDLDTKAIICFKKRELYPIRTSANSQRAVFLSEYNISLEEGNKIEF